MEICNSFCNFFNRIPTFLSWLTQGEVLISIALVFVVLWFIYYRFVLSDKLKLSYMPSKLNEFVVSNTPEFKQVYRPTPYLLNGNLQTIFYAAKRKILNYRFGVEYKRELLKLEDGGQLAMDWADFPEVDKKMTETTPIVAIFAGLTGGRKDLYVANVMIDGAKRGIKTVLVNQRGCSNTPMIVNLPPKHRHLNSIVDLVQMMHTSLS